MPTQPDHGGNQHDCNYVQPESGSGHLRDVDVAGGEDYRIRRRGYRQHECAAGRQCRRRKYHPGRQVGSKRGRGKHRQERGRHRRVARDLGEKHDQSTDRDNPQQGRNRLEPRQRRCDPGIHAVGSDGACKAQPTAEQDQNFPRQLLRRLPVHHEKALSRVDGKHEHQQGAADADHRVRQPAQARPCRQRLAQNPTQRHYRKHRQHELLAATHGSELGELPRDQPTTARSGGNADGICDAREVPPGYWQKDCDHGQADTHPIEHRDLNAVALLDKACQHQVRRRADQRTDAADGGRVGDAEHQRRGEGGKVR